VSIAIITEEKMNNNTILVLSNSQDGEHTDSVVQHLRNSGHPFFRLDVDRVAHGETKVVATSDSDSGTLFIFKDEMGRTCHSVDVGAVWYRRPFFYNSPIKDSVQKAHAEKEMDNLFEGLWRTLTEAFWLNSPASLEQTRKKMFQLHLVRSVGLNAPKTMVTNDPDEAMEFISSCKHGAVFKNIHTGYLDYGDESFVVPTTLVTKALIDKIGLIKYLPCLFQERIVKAYELRVTIVAGHVFPVFINSQKFQETACDWRHPDLIDKLDYREVELPPKIQQGLLQLMDCLGISFGAFDLAVDPEGQYWFFEVNGNGQWYWLEHETGLLISKAISDTLVAHALIKRG